MVLKVMEPEAVLPSRKMPVFSWFRYTSQLLDTKSFRVSDGNPSSALVTLYTLPVGPVRIGSRENPSGMKRRFPCASSPETHRIARLGAILDMYAHTCCTSAPPARVTF